MKINYKKPHLHGLSSIDKIFKIYSIPQFKSDSQLICAIDLGSSSFIDIDIVFITNDIINIAFGCGYRDESKEKIKLQVQEFTPLEIIRNSDNTLFKETVNYLKQEYFKEYLAFL